MADLTKLSDGWKKISIEDRGLLLSLILGSRVKEWALDDVASVLAVCHERAQLFVQEAVREDVLSENANGKFALVEPTDDLRKSWERRFHEVFWTAITNPLKKVGRANALKVWRTSVFALIKPKTEEGADALCDEIMAGLERYKQLLSQPNAPQMKYPEGWLSGQRWMDEIDDRFIERHGQALQQPTSLSPLERARRQQAEQQQLIEIPVEMEMTATRPAALPDLRSDVALPEFTVSL